MHTYSTKYIGESIHSFSFVLISSSAVLFALCPFINVIRWKTLHCIYCFLPVRSSPFPVTVLFEFRKMWNYSLAPFVLLLLQLLLLVPPGRDIRRPRKLPAIATKAAGRQQRNESKNLQLAGPAEREREERMNRNWKRGMRLSCSQNLSQNSWQTYTFRLQAQLPHMFAQMLARLFNFV